jgi:predicted negative regulator of RcsB-dependent stress response
MSENSADSKLGLSTNAKIIIAGVTTVAAVIFGYMAYNKYYNKRSRSTSSDSNDDTALIKSIKAKD